MSFTVFNETFYLNCYPDVKDAVARKLLPSGLDHFKMYGLNEGRVLVSPFYNEQFYLQTYPDVRAAVEAGAFKSGLQHFIQYGERENRQASVIFDPVWYARKNPDVTAAVAEGRLNSGLEHYLRWGQAEYRSATTFNELAYLSKGYQEPNNPDVGAAIAAGTIASALEHYIKYGQFEGRPAVFTGSSGNDTVTGFGPQDTLYGVDLSLGDCIIGGGSIVGGLCLSLYSFGVNEVDVLIGGSGKDTFALGHEIRGNRIITSFARVLYRDGGNSDFALIENFEIGKDEIVLAGALNNYEFVRSEDNLNIIIKGDSFVAPGQLNELIGTVRGVTSLSQIENSLKFVTGWLL